jgi:two-component system, OmpR family, aerobic respiration control sensor histidine kinase ArcB
MSFTKKSIRARRRVRNWLLNYSIVTITSLLGLFLTLVIVAVHCLFAFYSNEELNWSDLYIPLGYGALITPFVVFIISRVFSDVESSRTQIEDLQKNEKELRTSLAKTYIAIINARESNSVLHQNHEKLRGTLDNEINQRRETEEKLDEQVSFFSAIIDLTPDIILYRNAYGDVTGCNDNLQKVLGVTSKDELNKLLKRNVSLNEIICREDELLRTSKKDVTYEATINNIIYQIRKRPALNQRGLLIGIIMYGHDITKLKNDQDLLEKTSREKSTFISTLSHELRTPLNGIVGLSDILLQNGHFQGDDMRNLKAINVSAVTLGNIFNDVIDLNKMERQTFNIVLSCIRWKDFVEDLETLACLMTEQKNLGFNFTVEGSTAEYIQTDPTRLRQMLWNIIANAIKFTKKGSVSIKITQSLVDGKARLIFKISDTGIGIAKEEQQKIFDLYYQVAGTKQPTGTGIGLNVTKNLCKAFGGKIGLESELGVGTTFTLDFSFDECEAPEVVKESPKVSMHILLVEDVDLNILVAKTMLEKLGHTVIPAKTGKDAIETFAKEKFDLVLLDMQLPDMTGLDVADRLIADYHCSVPMVALTANVVANNSIYAEHKIVGVMSKPLTATKLAETLSKYQGNNNNV